MREGAIESKAGFLQVMQKLPPEFTGQDLDRNKELLAGVDPSSTWIEPASRHDAVNMRMMHQVLSPGVKDFSDADLRSQILFIGGKFRQGFCGRLEQYFIDSALVLIGDGV
jgi:hypothetical protein